MYSNSIDGDLINYLKIFIETKTYLILNFLGTIHVTLVEKDI